MTEDEAGLLKAAIAASDAPKIWRTLVSATPAAAVAFVNTSPAQVAGEAVFDFLSNGQVQVYYFL